MAKKGKETAAGKSEAGTGKAGSGKAAGKAAASTPASISPPSSIVAAARSAPDAEAGAQPGRAPSSRAAVPPSTMPSTASSSTVDDLARLLLVPVDVARRVLPERRVPFYLGVGALTVLGVVDPPVAIAAGLVWEALRRLPAR